MSLTKSQVSQLYVSIFNRASEGGGNSYWQNTGMNLADTANTMLATTDAATYFGSSLNSNQAFIEHVYLNTLNKTLAQDSSGIAYWVALLDGGMSRGEVVSGLVMAIDSYSPSGVNYDANNLSTVSAYNQFTNRVEVSDYMADTVNDTPSDYATSTSFGGSLVVTDNILTVDSAKNLVSALVSKDDNINGIDFTGDEGSKIGISSQQVSALTQESSQIISIDDFRSNTTFAGISGDGYSVVILDTGIDLDHPFFGADANADGISDRIVYTRDFTNDGDGTVDDVNGHGTNVASIAASSSAVYTGMASGADIIALQVLANDGQGSFAWIESALQWVVNNAQSYNIAAINMSLGDGSNSNTAGYSSISDELAALDRLGVINVAASGNDYYDYQTEGASNPATDSNVISVGATFDDDFGTIRWYSGATAYSAATDDITPFSQRSDTVVDIFAPGAYITGAAVGGGVSSMTGTSQASPHIAGIAVLAQELAEDTIGRRLSNSEFSTLLQQSGVAIVDGDTEDDNVTNTGDTYYRVDVNALGEAILALEDGEVITPPPTDSTDIEQTISTKGVISTDGSVSNSIETQNDHDWFKISLISGVEYRFDLVSDSTSQTPLRDPYLELYNSSGEFVSSNDDGGEGLNSSLTFIASSSGDYFLSARAYGTSATGDYILSATVVNSTVADDFGETLNSAGALDTTSSETGQIEISGDKDWFSLNLTAGNIYTIDLVGNTLSDPYIYGIYNYNNELVSGTMDDNGGTSYNSKVIFQPTQSGTYFVSAGANGSSTGIYTISLSEEVSQDDYSSNTSTTGFLTLETPLSGDIETLQDTDWFAVTLDAGFEYTIDLEGSPTSK